MKRTKIFTAVCLIAMLVFMSVFPLAVSAGTDSRKYVIDNENILSETEIGNLETKVAAIREEYNFDVVILVTDFGNKKPLDYVYDFYVNGGYGYGDSRDGAIIAVCVGTRDYAIDIYGKGEKIIDEKRFDKLEDKVVSYLKDDDFYGAFECFSDMTADYLGMGEPVEPIFNPTPLIVCVVIGLVVALSVTLTMKHGMKTARQKNGACNYLRRDSFRLTKQSDLFLYITRTRVKIQTQSNNSSRSSGGGGGVSHSGRSGKF